MIGCDSWPVYGLSKIDFLSKWQSITNGQLENILEIKSVKINGVMDMYQYIYINIYIKWIN